MTAARRLCSFLDLKGLLNQRRILAHMLASKNNRLLTNAQCRRPCLHAPTVLVHAPLYSLRSSTHAQTSPRDCQPHQLRHTLIVLLLLPLPKSRSRSGRRAAPRSSGTAPAHSQRAARCTRGLHGQAGLGAEGCCNPHDLLCTRPLGGILRHHTLPVSTAQHSTTQQTETWDMFSSASAHRDVSMGLVILPPPPPPNQGTRPAPPPQNNQPLPLPCP